MSVWRRKAIELLPASLKRKVERADSSMALWIELNIAAVAAFEARPTDDELLTAIFSYARYSWSSPDGDLSTAVVVAFYENIVSSKAARVDLHRWLSQEEFDGLAQPFQYHLSPEEFTAFAGDFRKRHPPRAAD